MRIGVFDSGIGGLTVLKELVRKYPNNEYIYVGDTLNIPYGTKSLDELKKLSSNIIDYLIKEEVDLIIIACGTISSNIIEYIKSKYSIPIIDIITPTIKYIKKNNFNKIGVLATPMTINSKVFDNKLTNVEVISTSAPKLVPAIEGNNLADINTALSEYLNKYINSDIQVLVLGCTHYPIVERNIIEYLGTNIQILNMGIPILDEIEISDNIKGEVTINVTKLNNDTINNIKRILGNLNYDIKTIVL